MNKFSLKIKLLIITLGSMIIFGVTLLLQFERGIQSQKDSIKDSYKLYTSNLSTSIANIFFNNYNNVQAFSKNTGLKTDNFETRNFLLNEMISLYPSNDFILITDLNGKYLASSSVKADGKALNIEKAKQANFSDTQWFKNLKNGKLIEDFDKLIFGAYFGQPNVDSIISEIYGEPRLITPFSTFIEDEYGDKLFILTAFTNMKWVDNELIKLKESMTEAGINSATISIVNHDNLIISHLSSSKIDLQKILLKKKMEYSPSINEKTKKKISSNFVKGGENGESSIFTFYPIYDKKFVDSINWSILLSVPEKIAYQDVNSAQKLFYITFIVLAIGLSFALFFILTKLSSSLLDMANKLKFSYDNLNSAVLPLSNSSEKLKVSTETQSSGIQETVQTLDEIYAMVKVNTETSVQSANVAKESEQNSERGQEIVTLLISAISQIKQCMEEIQLQVTKSNEKINQIVNVINDISTKTKVINDIVFQTKLLSFNASVEAARAGEHGKGFSVVAEEVGVLAETSGKAAKEIEGMLLESVRTVQEIVKQTQAALEGSMNKSMQEVENGTRISEDCRKILTEIVHNIGQMSDMAQKVSHASQEQEQGVSGITDAMNQLSELTEENSSIAQNTFQSSDDISKQTQELHLVINQLENLVNGANS